MPNDAKPGPFAEFDSCYGNENLFNYTFHISPQEDFVYVNNPKCGCTTAKASVNRWVAAARGDTLNYDSLAKIHDRSYNPLLTPFKLGRRARDVILAKPGVYRFTLFREPVDRLASAYASKLSWNSRERALFNAAASRPAESALSFSDFLSLIADSETLRDMNEHWRAQSRQIASSLVRYDKICLFERLEPDLLAVRDRLFPGIELGIFTTRQIFPQNGSNSAQVRAAMRRDEISLAKRIYAQDVEFHEALTRQRNRIGAAKRAAGDGRSPPAAEATMEAVRRILPRFESLGDNCEFGFVQRAHGLEAGGLLRWTVTPLPSLIGILKNKCEGLFRFDNLVPSSTDMVKDVQTGVFFHSAMKSSEKQFIDGPARRRQIFQSESSKIRHLTAKLLQRLADPCVIAVYKCNRNVSDADADALCEALAGMGRARLLLVRSGTPAGRVTKAGDRLLVATIDRFAPYDKAQDISLDMWNQLLLSAHLLVPEAETE